MQDPSVFLFSPFEEVFDFLTQQSISICRTCGACLSTSAFSLCSSEMRLSRVCGDIRNKSRMCSRAGMCLKCSIKSYLKASLGPAFSLSLPLGAFTTRFPEGFT